jgi:hypothetical protein
VTPKRRDGSAETVTDGTQQVTEGDDTGGERDTSPPE